MYSPRLLSPESAADVNAAQPVTCPLLGSAVRRNLHGSGGNSRIRAPQSGTFAIFIFPFSLVPECSTRGTLLLTQVFDNDPVRTTSLTAYVAASLRDAEAACGGSAQLQSRWLAKAEPEVLKQIYDAVTGNRP